MKHETYEKEGKLYEIIQIDPHTTRHQYLGEVSLPKSPAPPKSAKKKVTKKVAKKKVSKPSTTTSK